MSYLAEQEINCPYCKHPQTAELWSVINVREDPELKDLLLGGEVNVVDCEACHEAFFAEHFLLYHDPDNELMAFVFSTNDRENREAMTEKARADFYRGQNELPEAERLAYEPFTFFGFDELLAFVENDEEVGLQGEVVEAISQESRLPVRKLRPSVARRQNLPRVLPFVEEPGRSASESLVTGLRRLRDLNDRLTVYNETLERLSKNPAADLQFA
ncbi:MAG: hypothetical protein JO102_02720 [Elusimicrobia bacterium]|nr:hypothetical protein [Elusimicrobiota bacterium]